MGWFDFTTGLAYYVNIDAEVAQAFKAEYNIITDDLATYVHGVKVELTRAADIQPSNGCWFGGQFVLNAGSSGYTALDKPAYVLQAIFKGSDTSPNGTDIHVGRFETQSAGKVSDILYITANSGTTVIGSLEYIAAHVAPGVAMLNINAQSSITVPTGIKIMSGAGSSYNYGIDLASATINTADIRFSNSETISGLDDSPVNAATTSAISSNWAYDHDNDDDVHDATAVNVAELNTAYYDDVQDFINFFGDRTILSGGTISAHGDADGSIAIASCKAWCKESDSETAIGRFFDFDGKAKQTLTDGQANFIYLDYNGNGTPSPQIVVGTALLDYSLKLDHILMGVVFQDGNTVHIHNSHHIGISGIGRSNLHWTEHFAVHRVAGAVTSDAGGSARKLVVTAGVVYAGLSRNATNAFNTISPDTFTYWYATSSGTVWNKEVVNGTGATAISKTHYNDITNGGLDTLTANRYGVHWVYLDNDGTHLHVVYGQGDYKANEAEEAGVPATLPPLVTNYCVLIAKIICQQNTDTLTISYPWTAAFATSLATDHNALANLTVGDVHTQYLLADGTRDLAGAWDMGNQNLTNVDIDSGTIDGADITVGSGKTLDVSAGTLTLAADQISGDKVEGGTIAAITISALTLDTTLLTVTGAELNLLDLAGLTAGELLVATAATTAAWQSSGVVLTAPTLNGTVTLGSTPVFDVGSGWANINTTAGAETLRLNNTNEGGWGAGLAFMHHSESPAAADNLGRIAAYSKKAAGNYILYCDTQYEIAASTLGHEYGRVRWVLIEDGDPNDAMVLTNTSLTLSGGLTVGGDIACGAHNITLGASQTVDGIDVSAHDVATTGVHGISGTIVGTSDSQALTNKSYNGLTLTSTTGTFTLASGKTLTVSNTLTLTATDTATLAIGGGGTLGTAAYTASTAYVTHALADATNDFLVASGANTYAKQTLAQTLTTLGKAAASGLASLNASTKVVEQPASITDHLDNTAGGTDAEVTKAPTSNVMYDHAADVTAHSATKVKLETRDMTAASGDVAYTGYGFQPTGLIIIASLSTTAFSIGSAEPALAEHGFKIEQSSTPDIQAHIVNLEPTSGDIQYAVLKTFDADGFTLTWTKVSAPGAGTANLHVFAFK